MKKHIAIIFLLFWAIPFASMAADNYEKLWKEASMASGKDLPKTEIAVMKKIVTLAESQKNYGQLLAAETRTISLWNSISPDSLAPYVKRMEKRAEAAEKKDKVLAAVYNAVLGKFYREYPEIVEGPEKIKGSLVKTDYYFRKALKNPELLAQQKCISYKPLITNGIDSKIFNNDLLSVICMEAGKYKLMHDYYLKAGNRKAACISVEKMLTYNYQKIEWQSRENYQSKYLASLDSCIQVYKDLPEAGELAIAYFEEIKYLKNVSSKKKIEYIDNALKKWGTWKRINILRNDRLELTQPEFSLSHQKGNTPILPNHRFVISVDEVRNLQSLTLSIARLKADATTDLSMDDKKKLAAVKALASKTDVISQTKNYAGIPEYEEIKDSFVFEGLKAGVYLVSVSSNNNEIGEDHIVLYVSDLAIISESRPNHKARIAVVSATTGQPYKNARIHLSGTDDSRAPSLYPNYSTDEKGEVIVDISNRCWIRASTEDDKYMPKQDYWRSYSYMESKETRSSARVYTDRSIYRPGQKVQVAVVAFETIKEIEMRATAKRKVNLKLLGNRGKVVSEKELETDDYGTCSTEFQLPSSLVSGTYYIRLSSGERAIFRVEEYKRPTFEVSLPKIEQKYAIGDTLIVKGIAKTYAGVPVQGAKVSYNVVRRPSLWWWRYNESEVDILSDKTEVGEDGTFLVKVPLTVDNLNDTRPRFYNFSVSSIVTDLAGESHEASINIPLGTKATALSCDLPSQELKDSLKTITFNYRNAAGVDIPGEVSYSVDGGNIIKAEANRKVAFAPLASGKHEIVAICGTDTLKQNFVLFSMDDKQPVEDTHDWFYISANQFENSQKPVYLQVGSSDEKVHLFYNVYSGNTVIDQGTYDLNNELVTRKFTYKEEYGTGLRVTFSWIKEGVLYHHSESILQPIPDKKLKMEWTTFRDHLNPGQKETWSLRIKNSKNQPAKAQLMSVLYDKSLDQINKHKWNFESYIYIYTPSVLTNAFLCNSYLNFSRNLEQTWLNTEVLSFSAFDNQYFYNSRIFSVLGAPTVKRKAKVGSTLSGRVPGVEVMDASSIKIRGTSSSFLAAAPMYAVKEAKISDAASNEEVETEKTPVVQLRENLNETAFFYPNMETDANGDITLKFTLPESLTTWKFMGFAHDKEMNYGLLEAEAVASKKVMIQPNLPRFLREGDEAMIASKVTNTTDQVQKGVAKIELLNPETNKVVYTKSQKYELQPNSTQSVSFPVSQKEGIYIVRISAVGKGYSDGEQQYLAVLSNKELIINTLPITLHHKGDTVIDLSSLYGKKQAMTPVKGGMVGYYYSSPSWLMIQTLPSVSDPYEKDALSMATAYYANTIAKDILTSKPVIKQVIEQWEKEKDGSSLQSALEKNQDLKTLVLNETPWVMEADRETSQKHQLINYFDENKVNNRLEAQYKNLSGLQNADGSFSWWPGMKGSIFMTTAVAEILVRLQALSNSKTSGNLVDKAFGFMQKKVHEEITYMRKYKYDYVSEDALHYLYILALDGRKLNVQGEADRQYLLSKIDKSGHNYTILGKARISIILAKNGRINTAKDFLQSVNEYSVYREDIGRYYDARKAYYSWCDYKIPTQVAAIEAFAALDGKGNAQTIEEMQRWLLEAKRTQSWNTPYNTVNAVSAFFVGNKLATSLVETAPGIKLDGKSYQLPKASVGIGYFRMDIEGAPKKMTISKPNEGTSWGAVSAKFLQDAQEVEAAASGISIKREVIGNAAVGNKVKVRLTIISDRDYDFVQVVDKRAACLEPVNQTSGYRGGYYETPRDNSTNYYFDSLPKGKRVIETEYYIDRIGVYNSGTCSVQCAYAPEFSGRTSGSKVNVEH